MVLKGQFLERPTLIPVGPLVLEGVAHRGERAPLMLVLPPTPAEGGGMDHVVGAELAFAAASNGFPTLRFNYRGVGASQGERGQGAALVDDARAALELARDNTTHRKVGVVCVGGSVHVGLELFARGEVDRLFAISPTRFTPGPAKVTALAGHHSCEAWLRELGSELEHLELIGGADHTFQRGLPEVGKAVVAWLART